MSVNIALMAVSAFLGQVDISLIPYKEFMTAISGTEFGGVCLVTVTKHYTLSRYKIINMHHGINA